MTPRSPYIIRAIYEWIADNGLTPFIEVATDIANVIVPEEHIRQNKIVFDISMNAAKNLRLGNDAIEFDARFGVKICHIFIPISAVRAIFAKENNQGLSFPDDFDSQNPAVPSSTTTESKKTKLTLLKKFK